MTEMSKQTVKSVVMHLESLKGNMYARGALDLCVMIVHPLRFAVIEQTYNIDCIECAKFAISSHKFFIDMSKIIN